MTARRIVFPALMAALTAVLAQINVPVEPVPFTLQVLGVAMAGLLLGPAAGAVSMVVYLLLGLAGAPVFAKLAAGPGVVAGPTGGFLLAFPVAAFVTGLLASNARTFAGKFGGALVGNAIIYAVGVPWLAAVLDFPLAKAFALGMAPFWYWDALKSGLAAYVAVRLEQAGVLPFMERAVPRAG